VLVVHGGGTGFRVSREPLLHDPKEFPAAWEKELAAAGRDAKVKAVKAGKYDAFQTTYPLEAGSGGGARTIEIWRVRVAEVEMLYNFTFSLSPGADGKPLVEGVLKPFACTAPAAKLEFQDAPESIGNFLEFRLPRGYRKQERERGPAVLGGATKAGVYVKTLEGYAEPREAGRLEVFAYNTQSNYGGIPGTNVDDLTDAAWQPVAGTLEKTTEKLRGAPGRFGEFKGRLASASGLAKDGTEKAFHAFGTKYRTVTLVFTLLADARETRLFKNLFKEICETIRFRGG
jgi:hypothetical protein